MRTKSVPHSMTLVSCFVVMLTLAGCSDEDGLSEIESSLSAIRCSTDSGTYMAGDLVRVNCQGSVAVGDRIVVRNISKRDGGILAVQHLDIEGSVFQMRLAEDVVPAAYGLFLGKGGTESAEIFQGFFRVVEEATLTVFDVGQSEYRGMPVLALDGGLSAEYAVQKAGASLTSAFSHSWHISAPGFGPNPVVATPDFLKMSVQKTIAFYDGIFSDGRTFDTVIVSTGFPAVPYIGRALGAPMLPLQFLVSADSVKEIRGVLDRAGEHGYSTYSTLGHDTSFPMAVAWIKLLDLPREYLDFIKKHNVQNVIISGSTGVLGGETKSRRVIADTAEPYHPGSIYLLYPGTAANDEEVFDNEIADFHTTALGEFEYISDWESGIIQQQVNNFDQAIEQNTQASLTAITAENLIHLYDFATHVTAALMHKNRRAYAGREKVVSGVVMNPYLVAYPLYESYMGYIPYVYWQGNPASDIASGMKEVALAAVNAYFPEQNLQDLSIWLNATRNFGGFFVPEIKAALERLGVRNFRENSISMDEAWAPDIPDESLSVQVLDDLLDTISPFELERWNNSLVPLSLNEIVEVAKHIEGIQVVRY